jgi:hypothetical protein
MTGQSPTLLRSLLFRSRGQPPAQTCDLFMDEANPWVHVQGCPWLSVSVDVPTDVGREPLRSRLLTGGLPTAKHRILGQMFPDRTSNTRRRITALARWGSWGIPSAWRSPTTRQPRGSPRWNRCEPRVALPLGCRVVTLGKVGGMPHLAHPGPAILSLRPAIPEACPPGEGAPSPQLIRSSGRMVRGFRDASPC